MAAEKRLDDFWNTRHVDCPLVEIVVKEVQPDEHGAD
jgi:hypothetical protein